MLGRALGSDTVAIVDASGKGRWARGSGGCGWWRGSGGNWLEGNGAWVMGFAVVGTVVAVVVEATTFVGSRASVGRSGSGSGGGVHGVMETLELGEFLGE